MQACSKGSDEGFADKSKAPSIPLECKKLPRREQLAVRSPTICRATCCAGWAERECQVRKLMYGLRIRDPRKLMHIDIVALANDPMHLEVAPGKLAHLCPKRVDSVLELGADFPVPLSRQIGKGALHL